MRKKSTGLIVIISLLILSSLTVFVLKYNAVAKSKDGFKIQKIENQKTSFSDVYEEEYQNEVYEKVQKLKQAYRYDIKNPLLIGNPYQTVTNGLYVFFETKKEYQVEYVISADGYDDFVQIVPANTENNCATRHEFLMVGLIMGQKNTIKMNLLDEAGKVVESVSFEYDCPNAVGKFNVNQIEVNRGESLTPVSEGLYAILGNDIELDINDGQQKEAYLSMYDNSGVLRVEIPLVSYRAHRLLFDENGMYFSISGGRIVRMDNTGYVNRVYKLGNLLLHHDYLFGNRGDIVVLGTDTSEGTKEDVVFSIDLETKKIKTIIDLKDIFPEYYKMTSKPETAPYLDWMHINSFSFIEEESIILSSRETSTIIKLDSIYDEPTIDYMIGSENFWKDTAYEQYLLKPEGDFSLQAGQHTITYAKGPEGEPDKYYIYLYNNNNTVSKTRPSYDWDTDGSYTDTGVSTDSRGAKSSYYKYLIDTKNRSFTLVDSIEVPYSGFVSSVQEYQGNIIIDSGSERTTWEYDQDGELIQEIKVFGENWVYRTYKYDFDGYWFHKNKK